MSAGFPQMTASVWRHLGTDWVGKVHSVFRNSFNVDVEGLLLNIGAKPNTMSGLGIALPQRQGEAIFDHVSVGDLMRSTDDKVSIFPSRGMPAVYKWQDFLAVANQVPLGSLTQVEIRMLGQELDRANLKPRLGISLDDDLRSRLAVLAQPGVSDEERGKALTWLLGRGRGLTPSGDDIVAGYAFVAWCGGYNVLDTRLRVAAGMRTTAVSATMLRLLAHGEVSSQLMAVWKALEKRDQVALSNTVDLVERIGHTSGVDTLFGMLVGTQRMSASTVKDW